MKTLGQVQAMLNKYYVLADTDKGFALSGREKSCVRLYVQACMVLESGLTERVLRHNLLRAEREFENVGMEIKIVKGVKKEVLPKRYDELKGQIKLLKFLLAD